MPEGLFLEFVHTDYITEDHQMVDRWIHQNCHHPADENLMRLAERTKHEDKMWIFFTKDLRYFLKWFQFNFYPQYMLWEFTLTIAGSWGGMDDCNDCALGGSHTCKSLISLPRNIIYSKISSRGATGRSVGLSSVPNDRTKKSIKTAINIYKFNNMWPIYMKYLLNAKKRDIAS